MSKKIGNESRFGSLPFLLKGGAKPRRSYALMIALVLVAFMSFAGVVSADDYYKGTAPVTIGSMPGSVNGDFWVDTATTTWDNSGAIDRDVWANFTVPATGTNVKFARLYVTVYSGNMASNYVGYENVDLYNGDELVDLLSEGQALNMEYIRTQGMNTTYPGNYFVSLSRDTSDYVSIFDVKDLIGSENVNVNIVTSNLTPQFDGRIKQATLVVAYDVASGSNGITRYWVNDGQDPVTYKATSQVPGKTWFNGTTWSGNFIAAKVYSNYLASQDGTYTWNGGYLTPTRIQGNQTGLAYQNLDSSVISSTSNYLSYNRTANFYKIDAAFLKIKSSA